MGEWLKEHGIDVTDNSGNYRLLVDIVHDVDKIWDSFSDNEKEYVCDYFGGIAFYG